MPDTGLSRPTLARGEATPFEVQMNSISRTGAYFAFATISFASARDPGTTASGQSPLTPIPSFLAGTSNWATAPASTCGLEETTKDGPWVLATSTAIISLCDTCVRECADWPDNHFEPGAGPGWQETILQVDPLINCEFAIRYWRLTPGRTSAHACPVSALDARNLRSIAISRVSATFHWIP